MLRPTVTGMAPAPAATAAVPPPPNSPAPDNGMTAAAAMLPGDHELVKHVLYNTKSPPSSSSSSKTTPRITKGKGGAKKGSSIKAETEAEEGYQKSNLATGESHMDTDNLVSTGAGIFPCPTCQKEFTLKGNLKRHMLTHAGIRPFACPVCNRGFSRKADLEIHQRVHTGEKPYTCPHAECGRKFARISDLRSHERTHRWVHTDVFVLPCMDRKIYLSTSI